jgi:hypothetical protein
VKAGCILKAPRQCQNKADLIRFIKVFKAFVSQLPFVCSKNRLILFAYAIRGKLIIGFW